MLICRRRNGRDIVNKYANSNRSTSRAPEQHDSVILHAGPKTAASADRPVLSAQS